MQLSDQNPIFERHALCGLSHESGQPRLGFQHIEPPADPVGDPDQPLAVDEQVIQLRDRLTGRRLRDPMRDLVRAGGVGEVVHEAGDRLENVIDRTVNGRLTCAEALGHREFALTRLHPSA
jgi:hypothetical protein